MSSAGIRPVCPACRGELAKAPDALRCLDCAEIYAYENGFPNLVLGGRFGDAPDPERSAYEERSNEHTARHYWLPLFQRLFADCTAPPRVLSVGCGTGAAVDLLSAEGFDAAGVDCGGRSDVWPRRRFPHRLYLANGKHLPFQDATFDAVYCGCVFPHVGPDGDAHTVLPGYRDERLALASEMTRVLKPEGHILVSSPNRLCPVDLFHGRTKHNPFPRLNPPGSPFLLSPADYRALFREAGCDRFRLLPVAGYWGFVNRKTHWRGRLLAFPIECLFRAVSWEPLRFLRGAPCSPWLVMMIGKKAS
jgi:SAM-dependent methyltransferase